MPLGHWLWKASGASILSAKRASRGYLYDSRLKGLTMPQGHGLCEASRASILSAGGALQACMHMTMPQGYWLCRAQALYISRYKGLDMPQGH
jgi:hypothetical protein